MIENDVDALMAAESERCAAIRDQDYARLGKLLHPTLVHVHTRGNQDTRESYLKYLTDVLEIFDVTRENLNVTVYDDCAVMTGRQINTARLRGTESWGQVEAQVMQVWVKGEGGWKQVAFQATPVGGSPPAIPKFGAAQ
jgi:hypothetical protein